MFYLENKDGYFYAGSSFVDDLDLAVGFHTEDEAQQQADAERGNWVVFLETDD